MIEVLIFELTEEQQMEADETGVYRLEDCYTRYHTFLQISSFGEYKDKNYGNFTSIYSDGCEFLAVIPYHEFQALVQQELKNYGRTQDRQNKPTE